MNWIVTGVVAVGALLFGMYKSGPGSRKKYDHKNKEKQENLKVMLEQFKSKNK